MQFLLQAPEGSKVLIEFNSFDIDCGTDSLQIGFSMPGHPGKQFCGSGFETTIISSENYARFTLRTDVDSKSTGFEAVLKLVTGEITFVLLRPDCFNFRLMFLSY